jgi:hypothetical protein
VFFSPSADIPHQTPNKLLKRRTQSRAGSSFFCTNEIGPGVVSSLTTFPQVYGYEECRVKHDDDLPEFTDENFICTGTVKGGKSTCGGDSGGPLFDRDGIIAGVTSWRETDECGPPDLPFFKTRVSNYAADFIREGICQLSENSPSDCPEPKEGRCSHVFRRDRLLGRRSGYIMHRNIFGRCIDSCVAVGGAVPGPPRMRSLWNKSVETEE